MLPPDVTVKCPTCGRRGELPKRACGLPKHPGLYCDGRYGKRHKAVKMVEAA